MITVIKAFLDRCRKDRYVIKQAEDGEFLKEADKAISEVMDAFDGKLWLCVTENKKDCRGSE